MTMYCDVPPAFYSWSEPIARKDHECCECNAPIPKGEKYFCCSGKWEGGLEVFRQHLLGMVEREERIPEPLWDRFLNQCEMNARK